jgi:ribonuclease HII
VRDSKQLIPASERLAEMIKQAAVAWGIGSASSDEIDAIGINPATQLAINGADDALSKANFDQPDALFLDPCCGLRCATSPR